MRTGPYKIQSTSSGATGFLRKLREGKFITSQFTMCKNMRNTCFIPLFYVFFKLEKNTYSPNSFSLYAAQQLAQWCIISVMAHRYYYRDQKSVFGESEPESFFVIWDSSFVIHKNIWRVKEGNRNALCIECRRDQ